MPLPRRASATAAVAGASGPLAVSSASAATFLGDVRVDRGALERRP